MGFVGSLSHEWTGHSWHIRAQQFRGCLHEWVILLDYILDL